MSIATDLLVRRALQGTIDELRRAGAKNPDLLNALADVAGALVGEIAAPEFEARLARDFTARVRAAALRR